MRDGRSIGAVLLVTDAENCAVLPEPEIFFGPDQRRAAKWRRLAISNRKALQTEVLRIERDDLSGAEVHELLREHLASMYLHSPPESVHALPIEELRKPEITFWAVRAESGDLLGCGALKELGSAEGEIKSMRTATEHLRKGVAAALLEHILAEARRRGYSRLNLETGSMAAFAPARQLYERFGFTYCGPFADYVEDPNSVFMTKTL